VVVQPPVMEIKHQRMPTDIKFNTILAEYQDHMLDENERMTSLSVSERIERRDEFLLSVGEEGAIFMNLLVNSSKAKSVLETCTYMIIKRFG
jgi:predicted O-methyltransferase YrrM